MIGTVKTTIEHTKPDGRKYDLSFVLETDWFKDMNEQECIDFAASLFSAAMSRVLWDAGFNDD